MKILIIVGVAFVLIRFYEFCYRRHDEKIISMMQKGEGPDHYVSHDGRLFVNMRCIMKKMREIREVGEL